MLVAFFGQVATPFTIMRVIDKATSGTGAGSSIGHFNELLQFPQTVRKLFITAVDYNAENTHIDTVLIESRQGNTKKQAILARAKIVSLLDAGIFIFADVVGTSAVPPRVRSYSLNGETFIRTGPNEEIRDNLGKLPAINIDNLLYLWLIFRGINTTDALIAWFFDDLTSMNPQQHNLGRCAGNPFLRR